jgi:Fe-S-cluster-containing dehydrogenase component
MAQDYGLLIDYGWCSGCQSCEIACRNEHGWDVSDHGIKVLEMGPFEVDEDVNPTGIDWCYVPVPTALCDLCADRVEREGIPSCQLHCLAGVIEYGPVEELAKKMAGRERVNLIVPNKQKVKA